MSIKMKLSFSIFLILMLTQAALSVPVDKNSDVKGVKAQKGGDVEIQNIPAEILNKLKGLLNELSHMKIVENSKKVAENMADLIKQDLADIKERTDAILKHITSDETKKKFQDLLNELSNKELVKETKIVVKQLANTIEKSLSAVHAKLEGVLKRIDTPEKLKNADLGRELADLKLIETFKNMTLQMAKIMKNEYTGVKAKAQALIDHVYSTDMTQKLEKLMEKLYNLKVVEAIENFEGKVENVIRNALPGTTAKMDNVINHITSSDIKAKLDDLIDELATLDIPEVVKKMNEGAKNAVNQELHNVRVKANEVAKIVTSPEMKKKLQDLSNEIYNIKIVQTLINIAEGLKNLIKDEIKSVTN